LRTVVPAFSWLREMFFETWPVHSAPKSTTQPANAGAARGCPDDPIRA
jgi:hypothetical protein